MSKVLIVEDSLTTQALIQASIEAIASVKCVPTIAEAENALRENEFDLIVLDVLLPDGDGFDFCGKLRQQSQFAQIPLIFLTGQSEVNDKVRGLALGGDDYVVKPFSPEELQARIQVRLRRKPSDTGPLKLGGFRVDFDTQVVFFQNPETKEEKNLELTKIEFKLLVFFLRNIEKIFSRMELLQKVWGGTTHVSEHTVDTHISSLRKKIAASGYQVKSVVKQGYVFTCKRT